MELSPKTVLIALAVLVVLLIGGNFLLSMGEKSSPSKTQKLSSENLVGRELLLGVIIGLGIAVVINIVIGATEEAITPKTVMVLIGIIIILILVFQFVLK